MTTINLTHSFVYIGIPKTGSASINAILRGIDGYAPDLVMQGHASLHEIYQWNPHLCAREVFTVVRSIYDRAESMYRHREKRLRELGSRPQSLEDWAKGLPYGRVRMCKPQTWFFDHDTAVWRYPDIERMRAWVMRRFDIVLPSFPRHNVGDKSIEALWTPTARRIVEDTYARDLRHPVICELSHADSHT